jgi:hypothetical protein
MGEKTAKEFSASETMIRQVMVTYFRQMKSAYAKQMVTEDKENRSEGKQV